MKKYLTIILASLAILSATAQSNKIVKKDINVSAFNAITASSGWDIIVRQGNRQSVSIEVSETMLDRAIIEVKNGTLHIYNESSKQSFSWKDLRKMRNTTRNTVQKAYVTVTDLKNIKVSGGVDIHFETPLKTTNFDLTMSGGSDLENLSLDCTDFTGNFSGGCDAEIRFLSARNITANVSGGSDIKLFDINAQQCRIDASGGCDVKLKGKTQEFTINASGGCDVSASDFEARNCNAGFSGSADGEIRVTESLDITVSGSSDVVCYGNPRQVEKRVNKSSSLKMR